MNLAPARLASTVVLIRPTARRFDVFLVKRHDKVAFMGGAHVFPGGRVDAADRLGEPERLCDGAAEAVARMPELDPADAVGHHVAAIRELFEEAGVLLARGGDGIVRLSPSTEAHWLPGARKALADGTQTLADLAASRGMRLALDAIVPFAHWVTPEIEIKRFDTRFFVAAVPDGQEPAHDDSETTQGDWMDPADAVERCRAEEIALPPPTWTTLRLLSKLSSVDEVMRWARQRRVVRVQPGFIKDETTTMLTLPGDPTFPAIEGFDALEETRFILADGRWRVAR